jgi:hypothetical protein
MSDQSKMTKKPSLNLRLAMRVEGDWWNAYAADMQTMDGAVLIGTIRMRAVRGPSPGCARRKQAFMALMQDVINEFLTDAGATVAGWNDPERAPEHERAGRA